MSLLEVMSDFTVLLFTYFQVALCQCSTFPSCLSAPQIEQCSDSSLEGSIRGAAADQNQRQEGCSERTVKINVLKYPWDQDMGQGTAVSKNSRNFRSPSPNCSLLGASWVGWLQLPWKQYSPLFPANMEEWGSASRWPWAWNEPSWLSWGMASTVGCIEWPHLWIPLALGHWCQGKHCHRWGRLFPYQVSSGERRRISPRNLLEAL